MTRFDFSATPVKPPADEAFGPEEATWAQLELRVDDFTLTRHQPHEAFLAPGVEARDAVEGPLSGIAEWLVNHLPEVLWETHVPVPKNESVDGARVGVPGLRDAARWWNEVPQRFPRADIAAWQARHTLGAAASQLALPSLVFMPEAGRIGLFASALPAELNGNVRFRLPADGCDFWLERDDLRECFARFVGGVLRLASESDSGRAWAGWLDARRQETVQREGSLVERRRLRYGAVVAEAWGERIEPLGTRKVIVEGVLSDVGKVEDAAGVQTLLQALPLESHGSAGECRWKEFVQNAPLTSTRAYEQGYDLAHKVRHDLKRGSDPLQRVDLLLNELDISDREAESNGLFRTLSCVRDRQASVVVSRDVKGVVPRRVALAAAFGRLLFDSRGKNWGAALGEQSRWHETRRANAFAAELLAPAEAVRQYPDDPERLAADYGISLASARYRIQNVFHPPQ